MLQYLLNATAIWLLSLVLFDVLLRKDATHTYNRIYLLATLLMGMLIPLWSWGRDAAIYATPAVGKPAGQIVQAKQSVVVAAEQSQVMLSWQHILLMVYLAGVVVSLMFIAKEAWTIYRLYRKGVTSKDGVWTIVETGQEHSPFSAFRLVFISAKTNYDDEQLKMILMHEEQHGHSLHFIDLMLIQLAQVVFWFHPLVYVFKTRLLMIHEYQADAAVEKSPKEYGAFLIEQSMLRSAPALSHSFNRSPVKNRIAMLARKKVSSTVLKKIMLVPLAMLCVFCFSENAFSGGKQERKGNKLYYNGNEFEMWAPGGGADTVMVQDPVTGEMTIAITRIDSFPIKMNGEYIYRSDEMSRAETDMIKETTKKQLTEKLYKAVKDDIAKLPDGRYLIYAGRVVIDKSGAIVLADEGNGYEVDSPYQNQTVKAQIAKINGRMTNALSGGMKVEPVMRAGQPVNFLMDNVYGNSNFIVKDHEVTIKEYK